MFDLNDMNDKVLNCLRVARLRYILLQILLELFPLHWKCILGYFDFVFIAILDVEQKWFSAETKMNWSQIEL